MLGKYIGSMLQKNHWSTVHIDTIYKNSKIHAMYTLCLTGGNHYLLGIIMCLVYM